MSSLPDTLTPVEDETQTMENVKGPWGRLISFRKYFSSVDLVENSFSFGRDEKCTVMVTRHKFNANEIASVSKIHFSIDRNVEDNLVYITDLSKNGTFVNNEKLGKNSRKILKDRDIISITNPQTSLYMFMCRQAEGLDSFLPQDLMAKYAHIKQLGRGACGEVRLIRNRDTLKHYAVKKILKGADNLSQKHKINHPSKINNEINILESLCHPCIIEVHDILQKNNEVYIVLEYMAGGELTQRIITAHGELTETSVKFFFFQIVLGVHFLHSNGIAHRDLKPENILLLDDEPETIIKITDFGLSKVTDQSDMTTMCGTIRYVAPEVVNSEIRDYGEYGKAVDIWSLGVILYFMLSREYPFNGRDMIAIKNEIITCSYSMNNEIWMGISANAKDLISKMLVLSPRDRITLNNILNHPWIKNDPGMQQRVQKMFIDKGHENPLDYLVQEPPEKKFKFSHKSQPVSDSSDSTLLCSSGSFNSTIFF